MEVAKRAVWPLTAFGSWYVRTAKKHPFPVAFFTSGIKTSAADLLAQKVSYHRPPCNPCPDILMHCMLEPLAVQRAAAC